MDKKLKNTKSDIINKGDYIEAVITNFNNKLQIPAVFLGWDTMVNDRSVRFFNLNKSAPLTKGEAWLFKVKEADITKKYLNPKHKDREMIIFTVQPIGRVIDPQETYYDSFSKKWVEVFKCGEIYHYKEKRIPAKFETKIYKRKGMLHKLDIVTNVKTGKIIQVLHFSEFTLGEFFEESRKKFGKSITQISLKNIPDIPAEWLGKIKYFPFT